MTQSSKNSGAIERLVPIQTIYSVWQEHLNRYCFAVQHISEELILDVACGTGYGADLITNMGYSKLVAMDLSLETCRVARHDCGLRVVNANAETLPLRTSSCDTVISFETVEHLLHPEAFIYECARVLKPGGQLIISTPNRRVLSVFGCSNPYHIKEFSSIEFVSLLRQSFAELDFYGQQMEYYPIWLCRRAGGIALTAIPRGVFFKRLLKRILVKQSDMPQTMSINRTIDCEADPNYAIHPWNPKKWLVQPHYLICIARKG